MSRMKNPNDNRVVITGLGTINPLGNSVEEFWSNLIAGKAGIRKVRHVNVEEYDVRIGGEVDIPDLTDIFSKKIINRFSRFILMGHYAAVQALQDSGLSQPEIDKDPTRFGAIIGTGDGGTDVITQTAVDVEKEGPEAINPLFVVGHIPNTPPGYFAKEFNFQGPNFSVNSACASGNHAMITAAILIKTGLADFMLTGGTEAEINRFAFGGFDAINALSLRNNDPATASRPFDKDRDGFVLGEGAGMLCLEELEHAKKRGAKIYGELTGFGMSCDAYDLVTPHDSGRGAVNCMQLSLENAGLNPADIEVINMHATSTPVGDLSESRAVNQVFGKHTSNMICHSTKSMIGHLIGAAGSVEAIASILSLQRGVIHPSINVFEQDPQIQLHIARQPMEKKVKHVLSNSFGFVGQYSAIILSRWDG